MLRAPKWLQPWRLTKSWQGREWPRGWWSMPSWDFFEKQPQSYRDEVLPPDVTVRLAIEAASPFGWERYVGTKGNVVGIKRFGASAPAKVLAEKFGFTAVNIVRLSRELLGRAGG